MVTVARWVRHALATSAVLLAACSATSTGTGGGGKGGTDGGPINTVIKSDGGTDGGGCNGATNNTPCGLCLAASCCPEVTACTTSSACQSLISCVDACAAGDDPCLTACGNNNPAGVQVFQGVSTCGTNNCPACK